MRLWHGALFTLLGGLHPDLAAAVHDDANPKPFSLSPIWAEGRVPAGDVFPPGTALAIRVGLLADDLERAFMAALLSRPAPVPLGGGQMLTQQVAASPLPGLPVQPSWSQLVCAPAPAQPRLTLRFVSPTAFKQGNVYLPLPVPDLLVNSLVDRWQANTSVPLPGVPAALARDLAVSHHRIATGKASFRGYGVVGFTGEVTFALPTNSAPEQGQLLQTLGRLAYFGGVGYKSSMGLGTVELAGAGTGRRPGRPGNG